MRSHSGSAEMLANAQRILNAYEVPPGMHHDVAHPIPVTVRIMWERDGEHLVDTIAVEWTPELVRVWLSDLRWMLKAVWLPAQDVHRR